MRAEKNQEYGCPISLLLYSLYEGTNRFPNNEHQIVISGTGEPSLPTSTHQDLPLQNLQPKKVVQNTGFRGAGMR